VTQDDLIYRFRLRVFAIAAELGNVRAACRAMGIHPSTYYRWKRQLDRHGPEILRPRERRVPRMANQTSVLVEQRVVAFALGHPGFGPARIAAELAQVASRLWCQWLVRWPVGGPSRAQNRRCFGSNERSTAMTDVGRMSVGELVGKVLADEHADVLRQAVVWLAQELMEVEGSQRAGAGDGERSGDRVTRRNGYRQRAWDTPVGSIELAIPRLRSGS
jgi:hypothetical protein